jgi:branched-chain amino acid transport system permease protein
MIPPTEPADSNLLSVQATTSNEPHSWQPMVLRIALLALLALAISLPWWAERSSQRLMVEIFYTLALAQMFNLMAGYGGLVSVGQQAFVGIGGYCLVVLALQVGLNPFLVVPLAGIIAGLIAIPTAAVVFRLRGPYFAVGTWVVAEVFRLLTVNWSAVGGGSGLSITSTLTGMPTWTRESLTFWLALVLGLGATASVYWLLRSRYGLALTAVRDSEAAAESLGVPVLRIKWLVYIAAAIGCGMVGALIFITKLRISPDAGYSLDWTATMFFVVVIGGIGTVEGPIVGALVYFALRNWLSDYGSWYLIALGVMAVGFMLWNPKGIWGIVGSRLTFLRTRRHLEPQQGVNPKQHLSISEG